MTRRSSAALTFAGATLVGLAGGWLLAQSHDRAQRERLFARSPWRRHAALGHIEREGDTGAVPLLRDYLAWETEPVLRSRGQRVLRTLEAALG